MHKTTQELLHVGYSHLHHNHTSHSVSHANWDRIPLKKSFILNRMALTGAILQLQPVFSEKEREREMFLP